MNTFHTPASLVVEGIKRYENMNTNAGLLEWGEDITINRIIPEYKEYLDKEMKKQQAELLS